MFLRHFFSPPNFNGDFFVVVSDNSNDEDDSNEYDDHDSSNVDDEDDDDDSSRIDANTTAANIGKGKGNQIHLLLMMQF